MSGNERPGQSDAVEAGDGESSVWDRLPVRVSARGLLGLLALFAIGVALVWVGFPPRVVVTWETASEVETAGFHIHRGSSAEGPFSQITEIPVPAEGDPLVGASYRFEDRDVAWGKQYFYQLEELELTGNRNRYEEVVKARAGAGWPRALVAGVSLAALGTLVSALADGVLGHASEGDPKQ